MNCVHSNDCESGIILRRWSCGYGSMSVPLLAIVRYGATALLRRNPGYRTVELDMHTLKRLQEKLREFASQRDWEQFHSPKNLSMALIGEAAELIEHFQWLTEEQSRCLEPAKLREVAQEIADIQIYLIRIADQLGVDIFAEVSAKILLNEKKYPVDRVRGSAKKYTEYTD